MRIQISAVVLSTFGVLATPLPTHAGLQDLKKPLISSLPVTTSQTTQAQAPKAQSSLKSTDQDPMVVPEYIYGAADKDFPYALLEQRYGLVTHRVSHEYRHIERYPHTAPLDKAMQHCIDTASSMDINGVNFVEIQNDAEIKWICSTQQVERSGERLVVRQKGVGQSWLYRKTAESDFSDECIIA